MDSGAALLFCFCGGRKEEWRKVYDGQRQISHGAVRKEREKDSRKPEGGKLAADAYRGFAGWGPLHLQTHT